MTAAIGIRNGAYPNVFATMAAITTLKPKAIDRTAMLIACSAIVNVVNVIFL